LELYHFDQELSNDTIKVLFMPFIILLKCTGLSGVNTEHPTGISSLQPVHSNWHLV